MGNMEVAPAAIASALPPYEVLAAGDLLSTGARGPIPNSGGIGPKLDLCGGFLYVRNPEVHLCGTDSSTCTCSCCLLLQVHVDLTA